jgi:DNA ligase-1
MDPKIPVRSGEWVVVSHAHSDHTARHSAVILTEPTRRLMRSRISGTRLERVLKYGEPLRHSELEASPSRIPFNLSLHPAGHVLGSAMAHLEADGQSLLYTGDFKLRTSKSSERCSPVPADILIMETTYGRPRYVFPPTDQVVESVIQFCRTALSENQTPVLVAYSLGKGQEILASLIEAGLPIQLHASTAKLTEIYTDFGCRFPKWTPLNPETARGHVLITPTVRPLLSAQNAIGPLRIASLSGWALDNRSWGMPDSHQRFPLSDHADFPDLMKFVEAVQPRRVFTLHGFAAEFARHLRRQGVEAYALSEDDQLELAL